MTESTNRIKFVELCEKRVNKALKQINLIGNLSNRTNYKYDEKDVNKIVFALKKAIRELEIRFDSKGRGNGSEFKL